MTTLTTSAPASVRSLTKRFGSLAALDDVTFDLAPGVIHGLLGRNGAGKTTLMRILSGQEIPTSGDIEIYGQNPLENARVLAQTSFIREGQKYPEDFTVRSAIYAAAHVHPNWDQQFADRLLAEFALPLKSKIKKLSRGMLSSLGITIGLASRAPLTIFDEPYLGLDAVARQMFYDRLLEDYAEHPRTIILSTHLIDEVTNLIEHVILIDGGKVVMNSDAESLRSQATVFTGPATAVDSIVGSAAVLTREALGKTARVTAQVPFAEATLARAADVGVTAEPVSLQQLVVATTNRRHQANRS